HASHVMTCKTSSRIFIVHRRRERRSKNRRVDPEQADPVSSTEVVEHPERDNLRAGPQRVHTHRRFGSTVN
ncbi:MAG: hypothetical protein ACO33F_08020, partial [Ilumatobacteraceae bacterium]